MRIMRLAMLLGATVMALTGIACASAVACTVTEDGRVLEKGDPDPGGPLYPGVSDQDCAEIKRIGISQWRANSQAIEQARRASIDEQNEASLRNSRAAAAVKEASDDAAAAKSEKGQTAETICLHTEDAFSRFFSSMGQQFHIYGLQPMWCQNGEAGGEICIRVTRTSFNLPVPRPAGRWHLACVASLAYLKAQQERQGEYQVNVHDSYSAIHQVDVRY